MKQFTHLTEAQAFYNTRYKFYRIDGRMILAEVMTCTHSMFNPDGLEAEKSGGTYVPKFDKIVENVENEEGSAREGARSERVARNRARRAVFDICANNGDMDTFVTLTLDGEKIDRTDWAVIVKKLSTWLDNKVRRGGLKYVLVPEHHADGESVHFHGLVNSSAVTLSDSGLKDKSGRTIYNLLDWKYGYTTATTVGGGAADRVAVTKYISKYMTKSTDTDRIGGRYYLHGGDIRPVVYRYANTEYNSAEGFEFCPTQGVGLKIQSMI